MTIRIATRKSQLAMTQSQWVADQLAARTRRPVELVGIDTEADQSTAAIDALGSTGVFVAAIRQAVLDGRAELAVHSMKDLPTAVEPGLRLAAIPPREDARDVLCGSTLQGLSAGAAVGTGSPRRIAQLRAVRPDLNLVPIRGNVDTRLARLSDDLQAVVLAAAGLHRIGRHAVIAEYLPVPLCTPAPAQGALAVECRTDLDDTQLLAALADLDGADTRAAVTAERSLLATLEAGCTAPVGAYAVVANHEITLTGVVADLRGTSIRMTDTGTPEQASELGQRLAAQLIAAGAADLLGESIP